MANLRTILVRVFRAKRGLPLFVKYFVYCFGFVTLLNFYQHLAVTFLTRDNVELSKEYTCAESDCYACQLTRSRDREESAEVHGRHAVFSKKQPCPANPDIKLPRKHSVCTKADFDMDDLVLNHPELKDDGSYDPPCATAYQVAIVIPYRNREFHLKTLLHRLHNMLQEQMISYRVFVAEQVDDDNSPFNRGMMKNVGFFVANRLGNFSCAYFHDVDLIPEDARNIYDCPKQPRHHVTALNLWKYNLCYQQLVGGVFAIKNEHFRKINGFSNLYFRWGAEDDDFYLRLRQKKLDIGRVEAEFGRYTMLTHKHDEENKYRYQLIEKATERMSIDGLSSLKFKLVSIEKRKLFTHIKVRVNESEMMSGVFEKYELRNHVLRIEDLFEKLRWDAKFMDIGMFYNQLNNHCGPILNLSGTLLLCAIIAGLLFCIAGAYRKICSISELYYYIPTYQFDQNFNVTTKSAVKSPSQIA